MITFGSTFLRIFMLSGSAAANVLTLGLNAARADGTMDWIVMASSAQTETIIRHVRSLTLWYPVL